MPRGAARESTGAAASSEQAPHLAAEAADFVGHAPTQKQAMRVVVQPKTGRNRERNSIRQLPGDERREIVRCAGEREPCRSPESSVHLRAHDKILGAEIAALRGGRKP